MATPVRPTVTVQHLPFLKTPSTFRAEAAADKHFPPIADERAQMQSIKRVAAVGGAPSKLRGK